MMEYQTAAPKGRQSIAQGVSPGDVWRNGSLSPEGAAVTSVLVLLPPFRGYWRTSVVSVACDC